MRRGNKRKFGREAVQRSAFLKSLATALIEHGRITTTKARAKTLSTYTDKLVTKAKTNTIAVRRNLAQTLSPATVKKLCDTLAPQFASRPGGYTRIVNLGRRRSDGSEMSVVEFVS